MNGSRKSPFHRDNNTNVSLALFAMHTITIPSDYRIDLFAMHTITIPSDYRIDMYSASGLAPNPPTI